MSNVKGLLLPLLSLGVLSKIVELLAFGDSFWTITTGGVNCFFLIETLWFLSAMFVARILYWGVYHSFRKDYVRGLTMLLLLVVGVVLNHLHPEAQDPSHYHNFFHYRNAMCLSIFLWMGSVARRYGISRKAVYCLGIVYLPFWGLSWLLPVFRPVPYTDSTTLTLLQIPQFLLFAVTGTALMVCVSSWISNHRMLEYLGRQSLMVYAFHYLLMRSLAFPLASMINPMAKVSSCLFYGVYVSLVLIFSATLARLFRVKPLNYLVGKW